VPVGVWADSDARSTVSGKKAGKVAKVSECWIYSY